MRRVTGPRIAIGTALAALLIASAAHAQSSLGIGASEAVVQPTGGLFGGFFLWINEMQRSFYREMTDALKAMREDGNAAWLLVGLSFAYGIFHAAGPGHGKAVISSYMLANEDAIEARRFALLPVGDPAGDFRGRARGHRLSGLAWNGGFHDGRDMVHGNGKLCADRRFRLLAFDDKAASAQGAGIPFVGCRSSRRSP
jgi:hypothetical protein